MNSHSTGYTTGTCAAAAAKAAAMILSGFPIPRKVDVELPDGERVILPIVYAEGMHCLARAGVQKDAGGDPDITHGCLVVASVEWEEGEGVSLAAGDGVGIVTKPGLPLAPGEPAINPVPRAMIQKAVREVTGRGVRVTISIPGGRELADKTFNPRLGVEGGLSILGTSGLVRPFNRQALCKTLVGVRAGSSSNAPFPAITGCGASRQAGQVGRRGLGHAFLAVRGRCIRYCPVRKAGVKQPLARKQDCGRDIPAFIRASESGVGRRNRP
jgi:hypothetical protein